MLPDNINVIKIDVLGITERWCINPGLTCPFCDNQRIWTNLDRARQLKPKIVLYNDSSHYCSSCKQRFVLHYVYRYKEKERDRDILENETRSKLLCREMQLTIKTLVKNAG
jgi:hypothetical protein